MWWFILCSHEKGLTSAAPDPFFNASTPGVIWTPSCHFLTWVADFSLGLIVNYFMFLSDCNASPTPVKKTREACASVCKGAWVGHVKTTVRVELDLQRACDVSNSWLLNSTQQLWVEKSAWSLHVLPCLDYHWCSNLRHCMVDDSLGHMRQVSHEGGPHHILATSERKI